jgi:hypothetical protein
VAVEKPEDVIRFLQDLDDKGELDVDGIEDGLMYVVETLREFGVDPESEVSYRALLAAVGMISGYPAPIWEVILVELGRVSYRCIRDLRKRG